MREEAIAAGVGEALDEPFGAQLGEFRGQDAEGLRGVEVEVGGGEGAGREVSETEDGVYDSGWRG